MEITAELRKEIETKMRQLSAGIPNDARITTLEWAKTATQEQIDAELKVQYQRKLNSVSKLTKGGQDVMAVYAQKLADLG